MNETIKSIEWAAVSQVNTSIHSIRVRDSIESNQSRTPQSVFGDSILTLFSLFLAMPAPKRVYDKRVVQEQHAQ